VRHHSSPTSTGRIPADHVMGLPTLLRNVLGFPHPQDITPRGTPVTIRQHACVRRTNVRSAEDRPLRTGWPPRLPPHHAFPNAHQDSGTLRGPRAPHPHGSTHALHRRRPTRQRRARARRALRRRRVLAGLCARAQCQGRRARVRRATRPPRSASPLSLFPHPLFRPQLHDV
jgi:hypothetical protein